MPHHPAITKAAQPTRFGNVFDAWNSSSTGHQRPDASLGGTTAWKVSKTYKLGAQFKDGNGGGGRRIADAVGAGADINSTPDCRTKGQRTLWDVCGLNGNGKRTRSESLRVTKRPRITLEEVKSRMEHQGDSYVKKRETISSIGLQRSSELRTVKTDDVQDTVSSTLPSKLQIFRNCTIYINGSTHPHISDHALRRQLAAHGASLSIGLARRSVTHVVLGTPNKSVPRDCGVGAGAGAGGGLAAGKMQKEIMNKRNVKYVGVQWALESMAAGRKLGEARFEVVRVGGVGQGSVREVFGRGAESVKLKE